MFGQSFMATPGQLGLLITIEVDVVPVCMFCHVEDSQRVQMKVITVDHKTAVRQRMTWKKNQYFHQGQFSDSIASDNFIFFCILTTVMKVISTQCQSSKKSYFSI